MLSDLLAGRGTGARRQTDVQGAQVHQVRLRRVPQPTLHDSAGLSRQRR